MDVVDAFRDRDTRDELGIGIIRDSIADLLFPGTTTLMTRARYFLFAPWIYTRLESRRTASADIESVTRNREVGLINALLASGETDGVIGRDARERLQRLPGSIYWQGLGVWGIRLYPDSQSSYYRSLDSYYAARDAAPEYAGDEDVWRAATPNWHPGLPKIPYDFPIGMNLRLTREEADYLKDRLRGRVGDSLLSWLVTNSPEPTDGVPYVWEHPLASQFEDSHTEQLLHARNFSETILGAAILYNLMLAQKRVADDQAEKVADFEGRWNDWVALMEDGAKRLNGWKRRDFWAMADRASSIRPQTRRFVDTWLDAAISTPSTLADDPKFRTLIRDRETSLKGALARLANQRALDMWGGFSGAQQLDFRWGTSQLIINDIVEGLAGGNDA